MSPEVLNYYDYQITGDLLTMEDKKLFDGINNLNQPSLDPMDLLISGLSLKANKSYEKNWCNDIFHLLLQNYQSIKVKCKE